MFKTVTLKFKAKKNGVMLVRKYKYWIYRDKDRDGIADDDEDGGTASVSYTHLPMTVDEAIVQMELLAHTFYIFLNMETDSVNVVYRRNDRDRCV